MTYIELNDKHKSIIDTKGIRSIHVDYVSDNYQYIKIHYKYNDTLCSYEYNDVKTLYTDRERLKEKLGL